MTSETTGIEREIASTQADLGQSLEALGDRVAPKKLVARAKETAKAKVAEKVEDVKDRVSPPRVLRRRVGAVRSRLPEALGGDGDPTTQKTLPLASAARAQARQQPRGRSQADEPGTGRQVAGGASTKVRKVASAAAEAVRDAPGTVRRGAENNPVPAAAVAAAGAAVAASVLRPSDGQTTGPAPASKATAKTAAAEPTQEKASSSGPVKGRAVDGQAWREAASSLAPPPTANARRPRVGGSKPAVWVQPHHVHDGKWQVRREKASRASRVFDTQKEAERHGRQTAQRERVELIVAGRDGEARTRRSFVNDPTTFAAERGASLTPGG